MELPELLEYLRPHPTLTTLLLQSLPEEDFLQCLNLLDEQGALPEDDYTLALRDAATPHLTASSRSLVDVAGGLHLLGNLVESRGGAADLIATWMQVLDFERRESASSQLSVAWRRHVFSNLSTMVSGTAVEGKEGDPSSMLQGLVNGRIAPQMHLVEVDDLGPKLFGIAMNGPAHVTIVLSRAAHISDLEKRFALAHMASHVLSAHLPRRTFGVRLEYQRGQVPPELLGAATGRYLDGRYNDEEGEADELATSLLYPEYGGPDVFASRRSAAAHAHSVANQVPQFIYDRLRMDEHLIDRISRLVYRIRDFAQHQDLATLRYPPLRYCRELRVVRESGNRYVFVVGLDQQSNGSMRWVCSLAVLNRLGLRIGDVEVIPKGALQRYSEGLPLIDPSEVDQLRSDLLECVVNRRPPQRPAALTG